jgi:hypothetical protein
MFQGFPARHHAAQRSLKEAGQSLERLKRLERKRSDLKRERSDPI